MNWLCRQQKMDVVIDRIGLEQLETFILGNAVNVAKKIGTHGLMQAVSPILRAEDHMKENS
jgi:hypothetical protein